MALTDEQQEFVRRSATTLQIIAGALMTGVFTFLAIVLLVIPAGDQANQMLVNTYLAAGFACVALPASFIVPRFLGSPMNPDLAAGEDASRPGQGGPFSDLGEAGPLVGLYQTRIIIGLAILEGAAFFNVISYMLERQQVNLVMTGVLLAAMAVKFPTRGRLENWLTDELKRIGEERSWRS